MPCILKIKMDSAERSLVSYNIKCHPKSKLLTANELHYAYREREKLYLMINSPGYQEKTSEKIQESNADKLECLKQEISTLGRLWWMNSPGYRKKTSEEDQACSAGNLEFLEKEIMERLRCSFL